jgi:hypothetical protein
MTVFLLLQYVQPNLTVLLDNLGKKWDAFYNLKDTQTDVSYINQLPTNPPKRIEYNSYSYVISAVHSIRGKSPVMSKYFVWSLRV